MAPQTDPFQAFREQLDPRVAADLGGWAVERARDFAAEDDQTVEECAAAPWSQADSQVLRGLGERLSHWTADDSASAGFVIATKPLRGPLYPGADPRDFRRVLGAHRFSEIEAHAAYRGAQIRASDPETVATWWKDRSTKVELGRAPEVFAQFEAEREAMDRAASKIAAVRELHSRELGLTRGDPPDSWLAGVSPPLSPVVDAEVAMRRVGKRLRGLGTRQSQFEANAREVMEYVPAADIESLDTLQARLAEAMPRAALDAAKGRIVVPHHVAESLQLETEQLVANGERVKAMKRAGELYWGRERGADSRRDKYEDAMTRAERQGAAVARIEETLNEQREAGLDAGSWIAGPDNDLAMRGFAMHAVRAEFEFVRDHGREALMNQVLYDVNPGEIDGIGW